MDTIQSPQVTLKSGGYLVINQTEALVAIDVNSGKSTRERNIEETALKTNLEAAEELARQLRLRDMSGLIVVDFIDMEDIRNQHAVERRMKDVMRNDRARVQIGSISHFGLLEMSRQRLRLSINESISNLCPHCEGTGRIRSIDTAAMQVLRSIEDEAQKGKMDVLHITVHRDIALFILNHKRASLADIEGRFSLTIILHSDDSLIAPEYRVEREGFQGKSQPRQSLRQNHRQSQNTSPLSDKSDNDGQTDETDAASPEGDDTSGDEDQPKRRRRGRRGGRRRRSKRTGEDNQQIEVTGIDNVAADGAAGDNGDDAVTAESNTDAKAEKAASDGGNRRSVARNYRAKNKRDDSDQTESSMVSGNPAADMAGDTASPDDQAAPKESESAGKLKRKKAAKKQAKTSAVSDEDESVGTKAARVDAKKPARGRKPKSKSQTDANGATDDAGSSTVPKKPVRKSSARKAKKLVAGKTEDFSAIVANESTDAGSETANRAPITSAPQDVIDVGTATPNARKRGWWSRGK